MHRIKPSPRRNKARTVTFDCGCEYRIDRRNKVTNVNSETCSTVDCINAEIGHNLLKEAECSSSS